MLSHPFEGWPPPPMSGLALGLSLANEMWTKWPMPFPRRSFNRHGLVLPSLFSLCHETSMSQLGVLLLPWSQSEEKTWRPATAHLQGTKQKPEINLSPRVPASKMLVLFVPAAAFSLNWNITTAVLQSFSCTEGAKLCQRLSLQLRHLHMVFRIDLFLIQIFVEHVPCQGLDVWRFKII